MNIIPFFALFQALILLAILLIGLEAILRKKGVRPFNKKRELSKITPENKFYKIHPRLGFVHQQGNYSLDINNQFQFTATHDEDGLRITGSNRKRSKKEIWIFGCSFTYGWLVEDNETFPWLIQQQLSDWTVKNFGVNGYSTLQSYLQYKEAILKDKPPKYVLLAYGSSIHDKRNTFTRHRKKALSTVDRISPFTVPVARIKRNGDLLFKYDSMKYTGFPFTSYSALAHYAENKMNRFYDDRLNSKEVAKQVLSKFHKECLDHNSAFIVANINRGENTKEILKHCKKRGMMTIDISVDRSSKHPEYTHYPYDDHPSPLAHKIYAERIVTYLEESNNGLNMNKINDQGLRVSNE